MHWKSTADAPPSPILVVRGRNGRPGTEEEVMFHPIRIAIALATLAAAAAAAAATPALAAKAARPECGFVYKGQIVHCMDDVPPTAYAARQVKPTAVVRHVKPTHAS